jgi:hypothetical protein
LLYPYRYKKTNSMTLCDEIILGYMNLKRDRHTRNKTGIQDSYLVQF